jgi:hypothetical protein
MQYILDAHPAREHATSSEFEELMAESSAPAHAIQDIEASF